MVPVTVIVNTRKDEHVEHQKKTSNSNCDSQGCSIAVVVPCGKSLKKSSFIIIIIFIFLRVTHQIFF
jgi:hypothetical protein